MSQKLGFSRISRMEESSVLTEFVDRMIRITDELVDQITLCNRALVIALSTALFSVPAIRW